MREAIRGYTDAYLGAATATTIQRAAGELESVQALLRTSFDLRRVLADPGVPAASRRSVLSDLLGSRVDPATLALLTYPIEADRATEYPPDVDWLATRVRAAANNLVPVGEVILGREAATERLDGYADAVLGGIGDTPVLDDIEDELFRFMRIVDGAMDLRTVLTSRDVPTDARRGLVTGLLEGKARPETLRLAAYATQIGRPRDYLDYLSSIVDRVALESNRRLAEVVCAIEPDDAQRAHLADALSRVTGRPTQVRVSVDPSILGGFVATVGDTIVDGSVRHRLELLKDRLTLPAPVLGGTRPDSAADSDSAEDRNSRGDPS
jgi:F-type H+-transporting ATPase subunit delta